ncbi:MAG: serine/threonine protein kinase [Labilithrix sp.]|nr:serine/threonine protein kinase [Labilithrix sp.]
MEPGALLGNGRYVVRGVLGEGAQGTTFDAFDQQAGRAVAIKRFDVRGAKSWKDVELAEREARVLATLDHPHVPRYFDHFSENDALYLVMEKITGETLEEIRRRQGPLPEDEVRRFLACADRAMTYLHGRSSPVVHRDVKPRNVVRRDDGAYVFVDFGAVSELVHRRGGASTVVGTIGFMAPEQLQGRAVAATDVYAVGATALAALTGAEPDTLPHQGLRVDVAAALQGRASPSMIAILERMLEPDPDRRAPSVAAALEGAAAVADVPAPRRAPKRVVTNEDAAVKSIRNLLWLLWGLGWIIVPLLLREVHAVRYIPLVMFGALASLFVVTWHKGAVIRAMLRAVTGRASQISVAEAPQKRVDAADAQRVRVHATQLRPEEMVGQTEIDSLERDREREQRKRARR